MAFSNSKSLLLQTRNHVSPLLMIPIFPFLLLNNVISQSYHSPSPSPSPATATAPETVGFNFSFLGSQDYSSIALTGDASIAKGALQLTRKDTFTVPVPNSIGRAQYRKPVHLWDKTTGNLADFSSSFSFPVIPTRFPHGDGLAFFLGPVASRIPENSSGGYLGLFSPQTAINNTNNNQIVAIEFDTNVNPEWDPPYPYHIGIDVNSINSTVYSPWPEIVLGIATASINYTSESKNLSVSVSFKAHPGSKTRVLSHVVDLRTVLPEWVSIGFSAATGQFDESHEIFSWSFEAAL